MSDTAFFAKGRAKTGGRQRGVRNKRTIAAESAKLLPDGLAYLAKVMASEDATVTPDMKLKAAICISQYQHAKPAPVQSETFVGLAGYVAPTTPEEARAFILKLGERLARREVSVEAHDCLVNGLKTFLGDVAADQERRLADLEELVRYGPPLEDGREPQTTN
jgi:hypothetical protein